MIPDPTVPGSTIYASTPVTDRQVRSLLSEELIALHQAFRQEGDLGESAAPEKPSPSLV